MYIIYGEIFVSINFCNFTNSCHSQKLKSRNLCRHMREQLRRIISQKIFLLYIDKHVCVLRSLGDLERVEVVIMMIEEEVEMAGTRGKDEGLLSTQVFAHMQTSPSWK